MFYRVFTICFILGLLGLLGACDSSEDSLQPELAGEDLIAYYTQVALANFEEIQDRQTTFLKEGPTASPTETWVAGNTYVLRAPVVVRPGDELIIEEGAIVKAFPGQADRASYLIVEEGGKLRAEGSATTPIVFTSLADRIKPGEAIIPEIAADFRLPKAARGLWGGVIILGGAPHCAAIAQGENELGGIPTGTEVTGENGMHTIDASYGSSGANGNVMDNSGSLRYVSIRHSGVALDPDLEIPNNEINGLILGAVGAGTSIDYVEVFAARDDGFQFYGGTVNTKHLLASFCGDDHFDYSQCYQGHGQYWLSWQDNFTGDRAGEFDGEFPGSLCNNNTGLISQPVISNMTALGYVFIDQGMVGRGSQAFFFRNNGAGYIGCSIFATHARTGQIENLDDTPCGSSYQRLLDGDLVISNSIFYDFFAVAPGTIPIKDTDGAFIDPTLFPNQMPQLIADNPGIGSLDFLLPQNAIALLSSGNTVQTVLQSALDNNPELANRSNPIDVNFLDPVTYKGAFDPNASPWTIGWTAFDKYYLTFFVPGGPPTGTE